MSFDASKNLTNNIKNTEAKWGNRGKATGATSCAALAVGGLLLMSNPPGWAACAAIVSGSVLFGYKAGEKVGSEIAQEINEPKKELLEKYKEVEAEKEKFISLNSELQRTLEQTRQDCRIMREEQEALRREFAATRESLGKEKTILQQQIRSIEIDRQCSITLENMKDPVQLSSGFSYERSAIVELYMKTRDLNDNFKCPLSGKLVHGNPANLETNIALRNILQDLSRSSQPPNHNAAASATETPNPSTQPTLRQRPSSLGTGSSSSMFPPATHTPPAMNTNTPTQSNQRLASTN